MNKKIKICHFNGKRGGFGALKRTLKMIKEDPCFELQLVVGDMHVSNKFGKTIKEVEENFEVSAFVDMKQAGGRAAQRSVAIGVCLEKITSVLEKLKPDLFLCLGDRGEVLASVIAAVNLKIPVLHVEGGDKSGNLDEYFRHAITKLSHIHFPSTKQSAGRIKKMGEEKWRIHVVGDAHIDPIVNKLYTPVEKAVKKYNLKKDYLIVIQHPETINPEFSYSQMVETLKAVKKTGLEVIVVYPCSDQGYEGIIKAVKEYKSVGRFKIFKNIVSDDFLGLLEGSRAIVGNSSCGIKEAAYFRVPVINIGKRQSGRLRESSVIDVPIINKKNIFEAIKKAFNDKEYKNEFDNFKFLYGHGKCAEKIIKVIKNIKINQNLFEKKMTY